MGYIKVICEYNGGTHKIFYYTLQQLEAAAVEFTNVTVVAMQYIVGTIPTQ